MGAAPHDDIVSQCGGLGELPRPLAFVLSGGAASGATQVGMLLALRDAHVAPDMIIGTSVGAINGVMIAAHPDDGALRLRDVWATLDKEGLLGSSSLRSLPRLVRTRRHLYRSDGLRGLLHSHLSCRSFDQLALPFVAVATNASAGTTALLQRGPLEPALLASAAIPGIFPRVEIDGAWYFDGGITANVPVRQALRLGAQSVIVLNASPPAGERPLPANIAETIQYAVSLMMRNQAAAEAVGDEARPIVRLPQTSPANVGVFDFARARELIDLAHGVTGAWLAGVAPPVAS